MGVMSTLLEKYRYYNKPDGQDPLGKLIGCSYMMLPPLYWHFTYQGYQFNEVLTFKKTANLFAYWAVPIACIFLAFSSVTFASTYLRKKDDTLNYYLGVASSCYIMHKWQKCWNLTGITALAFGYYVTMKTNRINITDKNQLTHEGTIIPHKMPQKFYAPSRNYEPLINLKSRYAENRERYYRDF